MKINLIQLIVMLSKYAFIGLFLQTMTFSLLLASETIAQENKSVREVFIDVKLKNADVFETFKRIESLTDFKFNYERKDIISSVTISIYGKQQSVADILMEVSKEANLKFRQVNNNINVNKLSNESADELEIEVIIQGITVTGKVTSSEDNEGLPGVNVIVKGTSQGTVTDLEGNYSLEVPGEETVLVFSSVGFLKEEVIVGNQTIIDFVLSPDVTSLEEIVVIGYGTAKKSDVTGSVASVSPDELVDRPVVNIGQALQNKVSGVQVIKSGAGIPGSRPVIRIRGTNSINSNSSPLFVVDGIVGVNNALENINPQDIKSMDILKDASATAIYGTRGANGVIIITTKRGEVGKTKINYNGSVTMGTMQRHNYTVTADQFMYQYYQAIENTPKYGTLKTEKDFRGGMGTGDSWSEMPHLFEQVSQGEYFLDVIGNDGNYYKPRFYSDWEDIAFNNSFSQDHYIDVSGGTETAKFALSVGNTYQDGLMIESYYKRTNARFNADIEVNKWLGVSANIMYSRAKSSRGADDTRTVSEAWPIIPSKYPDDPAIYGLFAGKWATGRDFPIGENWPGIEYRFDQRDGYFLNEQITGGFSLNAQITEKLSFKSDLSVDSRSENQRWYNGNFQGNRTADADGRNAEWFYWQNENYFNYFDVVGDHSFGAMVGLSWQETTYDYMRARAFNFSSNFYQYNNFAAGTNVPRVESDNQRSALNSYFARVNYAYKDKYLVTATGRIDGSSKFGPNNKYAFFPSIGVGWRISQEDFMTSSSVVSNLKLRGSAGQTGNQEIGSFVTQRYINATTVMFGGGNKLAGLYPGSTGNPDLKWETTFQWNIGIDLGLFNNRVNLVIDYYDKLTDDMLFNLPLPESTAPGSAFVNFGQVSNKGIELGLNTVNIENDNFLWETNFTISANKNEILKLGPTGADVYRDTGAGNATSVYRVGESIGSFFGLNRMGVYGTDEAALAARYGRVPGDLKFEDVNQDGKIELISDGNVIGKTYPDYYGGFINTFRYKNWDANISIQFVGGVDKAIVHESAEDRQFVSGMVNRTLDAWRPDYQVDGLMVAQIRAGNAGARYDSFTDTHEIYNAAFIRGSLASIGYTVNDVIGISRLRVYVATENFFLLTPIELEGYDPEGSSPGKGRDNVQNIDKYQYPNPTNFILGVNVSF